MKYCEVSRALIFNGKNFYTNKFVYNFIIRNEEKNLTFTEICFAASEEAAKQFKHKAPTPMQVALAIRALRRAGLVT